MLPPGTLQTLIRRYQAARTKMEGLAAEVALALSLPGQAALNTEAPVRRPYTRRAPNGERHGAGGKAFRMEQIVAALRKHGPSSARDMVRLVPTLSMGGAYTAMYKGVKDRVLVRTGKGVYAAADSHAALPAIMRQGIKGKKKGKPAVKPMRAAIGGGVSRAQQLVDMAEKAGGVISVDDVLKAKLFSSRKLAGQALYRNVRLNRFTALGDGRYELKKTPAG